MDQHGGVSEALDRLAKARLMSHVVAVRAAESLADGVQVVVRRGAPETTVELIDGLLAEIPHRCVTADVPYRGTVDGLVGTKDGVAWPIGTPADAAWITEGTTEGPSITSAIPALLSTASL